MKPKYLLISQSCYDCGNIMKLNEYDHKPTEDEKYKLNQENGEMFCLGHRLFLKKSEDHDYEEITE